MPRVLVCGCSGSGKSTFAKALVALTGLPFVSLDKLYWLPGWVESEADDFRARVAPIIGTEDWVMDGNQFVTLRAANVLRATHLYFFDLPRWQCLKGAAWRVVSGYGRVREEMAPGCPERFDLAFFQYIWNYRAKHRPRAMTLFAGLRPDQSLTVFHARRQADAELARIEREGLA